MVRVSDHVSLDALFLHLVTQTSRRGFAVRLRDCSNEEALVLTAMVALADQLPADLISYTNAIGELTRRMFPGRGGKRGAHNPSGRSLGRAYR